MRVHDLVHVATKTVPEETLEVERHRVAVRGHDAEVVVEEKGLLCDVIERELFAVLRRGQGEWEDTFEVETLMMSGVRWADRAGGGTAWEDFAVSEVTPATTRRVLQLQKNAVHTTGE